MDRGILDNITLPEEPAAANGGDLPSNDIPAYEDDDLPFDDDGSILDPNEIPEEEDYVEDDDLPSDEETQGDNEPESTNKIRRKEHIVKESPGAFAQFSYKIYVPDGKEEDEDEDEDRLFENEDEKRKFELYVKEYIESDGFDIEHFCNKICGGLRHLFLDEDESESSMLEDRRDCKLCVEVAIDYVNQKNNLNLELEKIIKCNWVWGCIDQYYATFVVKDKDIGANRTYQAQVACDTFTGKKTIKKFRLKPDSLPEPEITNGASTSFFVW